MNLLNHAEATLRRDDFLRGAPRQRLIDTLKQPERPTRRSAFAFNLRPSELRPPL